MQITYDFPVWIVISWVAILLLATALIRMHTKWRHLDDRLGGLAHYHWLPVGTDTDFQIAIGVDPENPAPILDDEQRIKIRDCIVEEMMDRAQTDNLPGVIAEVVDCDCDSDKDTS